jgi:chloramphenicol 3-O-phosphotransferase
MGESNRGKAIVIAALQTLLQDRCWMKLGLVILYSKLTKSKSTNA